MNKINNLDFNALQSFRSSDTLEAIEVLGSSGNNTAEAISDLIFSDILIEELRNRSNESISNQV